MLDHDGKEGLFSDKKIWLGSANVEFLEGFLDEREGNRGRKKKSLYRSDNLSSRENSRLDALL